MANYFIEKNLNHMIRHKKLRSIDFQKYIMYGVLAIILIIATISMAIADESIITQSFLNSEIGDTEPFTPRGHIEDFSWTKRVSSDGVIEISGIGFSVVNDDDLAHSFEICTIVQGPLKIFTPSLDSSLACTSTDKIENNGKITNQYIGFPNGVKVSDLVDISITIQEFNK